MKKLYCGMLMERNVIVKNLYENGFYDTNILESV